ncbi:MULTISPECIES: DUF502 domain-containing protein [Oleiagrimonas]|jgi:uncharacterized membrane protein|uniref:DUF502 domain-containing protein n=1 Tax=Oleiagrimonas citrea TaxID=1665687 RepID=A0A846ZK96_9GAMM|nr:MULTISPECIES: DUF502 domain-containing protein [Oleiagrimonas]NKZ37970.1 DUF502 domain-containing protein [Oleiagrimonas citrea]RAP57548.1 hypothetical protein BTJ49_10355 [Oleiagrimonas sp. MCCC 1A03011]
MRPLRFKRYLLTGLLTFLPLWVTWLVFSFVLGLLASLGTPLVNAVLNAVGLVAPHLAQALNVRWILNILALLLTVVSLYLLGLLASRVIGQRMLSAFDTLLERIPLVQTIYGGTKKLMNVLQTRPDQVQRVVLVDFPREGMKVVGFVTRVMREEGSNREMAAVYIPTTPNPTGGYLEVVPVDQLTPTDWTMDQAMAFIISGGAVAPDTLPGLSDAQKKARSTVPPSVS